ncbi:hypothetical protein [Mycobacterium avium]|nr:hypothetical protein [Mycobacterium avium]
MSTTSAPEIDELAITQVAVDGMRMHLRGRDRDEALSAADRPMSSTSATGLTICERGRHVRVIYRNSLTGDKACVESHMVTGTLAPVSDLLPNLDALLKQLSGDAAGQRDARALAEAVAQAGSEEDVDTALDAVIAKWRQSS